MFTRLRTFTCPVTETPPAVPPVLTSSLGDPYWDQVVLLLHLEGSPGQTVFIDEKNAVVTGSHVNYVTELKVFGTSAVQFTPTAANCSLKATFAKPQSFSKDFTVEFFIYFKSLGVNDYLFDFSNNGFILRYTQDSWRILSGGDIHLYSNQPALNTWHHVVVQRRSNMLQLFINGIKVGEHDYGTTTLTSNTLTIGNYGGDSGGGLYTPNCAIDEFRITNGVARYLDNFSVPTAPFLHGIEINTDYFWPQTRLLLKATSTEITDASNTTGLVLDGVSTNELAKVSGYSIYFNNSRLTLNNPSAFSFGTSDFTIESWIYVTSINDYAAIIDLGSSSISSRFCLYLTSNRYLMVTTSDDLNKGSTRIPINQWIHVAVVRQDGILTYYVNGNACGALSLPNNFVCPSARLGKSWANSYPFTGYMQDFRITKHARYSSNFTPKTNSTFVSSGPGAEGYLPSEIQTLDYDPYWYSSTVLAMPLSTDMLDLKNNSITTTASLSANKAKFTGSSLLLDGVQSYFSTPYVKDKFDWWTSDYTLECWIYLTSFTGASYISSQNIPTLIGNRARNSSTNYWSFGPRNDGKVVFHYVTNTSYVVVADAVLNLNTWSHIAFTKTNAGITIFVNGNPEPVAAINGGIPNSSAGVALTVGAGNNHYINGYIQDLRITKGVARYSLNFTPANKPNQTYGASF